MAGEERGRPRRPVLRARAGEELEGGIDPARRTEAAHASAAALVQRGRAAVEPAVVERLVRLADEQGLDELAELWAGAPPVSLPGALWRLYLLRTWVGNDPLGASREFGAGRGRAVGREAVAGVADPPGPDQVRQLADAVLTGVFRGELDVALDRAAAFCWVVALGRAALADEADAADPGRAAALTRRGLAVTRTAEQLADAARRWRDGSLV